MSRVLWMLLGLLLTAPLRAQEAPLKFAVDLMAGESEVDVAGYNRPPVYGLAFQFQPVWWGGVYLARHEFDHFRTGTLSPAVLSLKGNEFGLYANIPLGERFALQPTVGNMWYELDAEALNQRLQREEKSSTTFGLTLRLFVGAHGALLVSAKRAQSVSQTTIDWVSLGASIRF